MQSNAPSQSLRNQWAPAANVASYRDLLRFEQRLLQNAETLARQRRKYQLFMGILVLSICSFGYRVFLSPSIYLLVHYAFISLLLIAVTSLALFFATGMYSEKIARAYKYVPQANRSLRPFNMHLNTRVTSNYFAWPRRRRAPADPNLAKRKSPTSSPPASPLKERPTSPLNRQPIQAMPPASNPRGEIIFSNRIDPSFRQGYERFRSEWERRQKQSTPPAQSTAGKTRESKLMSSEESSRMSSEEPISKPRTALSKERGRQLTRSRSMSPDSQYESVVS